MRFSRRGGWFDELFPLSLLHIYSHSLTFFFLSSTCRWLRYPPFVLDCLSSSSWAYVVFYFPFYLFFVHNMVRDRYLWRTGCGCIADYLPHLFTYLGGPRVPITSSSSSFWAHLFFSLPFFLSSAFIKIQVALTSVGIHSSFFLSLTPYPR